MHGKVRLRTQFWLESLEERDFPEEVCVGVGQYCYALELINLAQGRHRWLASSHRPDDGFKHP
jgi:hypothetical protein